MFKRCKEQPMNYWEQTSHFRIILDKFDGNLIDDILNKVSAIEGVTIEWSRQLSVEEHIPGSIKLTYCGEQYEVGYHPNDFYFSDILARSSFVFAPGEMENISKARDAITVYMDLGKDPQKGFHLQLKIVEAIAPNMLGLLDESAERLLPAKWVKMAAKSKVVPGPNSLYGVQTIAGDKGEVWLHTHGLNRCGVTELEVLQSNANDYYFHYHLIQTYASYLLENIGKFDPYSESAYIGRLINGQPIVVACLPWVSALKEYKKLKLGNADDRKEGHNSKTSVIFVYKTENDEKNKRISKLSDYNGLGGDNPLLFISNKETERMQTVARERFNFVKAMSDNKENNILIKIALLTDDGVNCEHIYFQLIEFVGDKFRAKLIQEPYNVSNIHEGDEREFTANDVTDWVIYTPESVISAENAYLLS